MKKFISIVVILLLISTLPVSLLAVNSTDQEEVCIRIQGEEMLFEDQAPIIYLDRVMVPLRRILECGYVQAKVHWDEENKLALIYDQRGYKIQFILGEENYQVIDDQGNLTSYALDAAPIIVNDSLLIPIRAFMETFEFNVKWLPRIKTVEIRDSYPAWRKLLPLEQWHNELEQWQNMIAEGGGCLPCLLKKMT